MESLLRKLIVIIEMKLKVRNINKMARKQDLQVKKNIKRLFRVLKKNNPNSAIAKSAVAFTGSKVFPSLVGREDELNNLKRNFIYDSEIVPFVVNYNPSVFDTGEMTI